MKRFTARTIVLVTLCLVLLTGIALAAAGVFGTLDYLRVNTSAPADGAGVNVQTQIRQTGGDFPDLTATVRDAVYDGTVAYVTVAYKLKNPDKYMLLSDIDTFGLDFSRAREKYGEGGLPPTDPAADPREKLVLGVERTYVYGERTGVRTTRVYEQGDTVVLIFQIQLFGESLLATGGNFNEGPVYSWATSAYQVQPWEPEEKPPAEQDIGRGSLNDREVSRRLADAKARLTNSEPLELKIKIPLLTWDGEVEKDQYSKYLGKYYCTIDLQIEKTESRKEFVAPGPITQGKITLQSARFTFTDLATYAQILIDYSAAFADGEEYGNGVFEMVDSQGNIIPGNVSGGGNGEFIWWPAVKEIPGSVTVRVRREDTGEILGTFDIPLEEAPKAASGT